MAPATETAPVAEEVAPATEVTTAEPLPAEGTESTVDPATTAAVAAVPVAAAATVVAASDTQPVGDTITDVPAEGSQSIAVLPDGSPNVEQTPVADCENLAEYQEIVNDLMIIEQGGDLPKLEQAIQDIRSEDATVAEQPVAAEPVVAEENTCGWWKFWC